MPTSFSADAARLAQALRDRLATQADAARAAAMSAYMRGQFAFLGVPTPLRRSLARSWIAEVPPSLALEVAEVLWHAEEREAQYAACDLLAGHVRALPPGCAGRLAALVCARSWWDTVDPLASNVFGSMARRDASTLAAIDGYVNHAEMWLRRVALLYQLQYKTATDLARLQAALDANLPHPDFFIRKAMGWALRQYARTDPEWVRIYLRSRGDRVPPLTRREAAKHL